MFGVEGLHQLWEPEISIAEKVLRSAFVYFFILLAFRFTGKRQIGQLSPFDLVVLLIIANVVQNAVIGPDNSLGGGLIGAVTILGLNYVVVGIFYRSKRLRHFFEAGPTVLVHNGKIVQKHMSSEKVTMEELMAAIRGAGLVEPSQVRFAVLEEQGTISVVPMAKKNS